MCSAWRLPGAHRFGIGYDAAAVDGGYAEDGYSIYKSMPNPNGKRCAEQQPPTDPRLRPEKIRRPSSESVGIGAAMHVGVNGGSLYSWSHRLGIAAARIPDVAMDEEEDDLCQNDTSFVARKPPKFCVNPTGEAESLSEPRIQTEFRPKQIGEIYDWDEAFRAEEELLGSRCSPSPTGSPIADDDFSASTLVYEVPRILVAGDTNYRSILNLSQEDANDTHVIQSKYRQLMRLLHPDKRRADEVEQVGGSLVCDRAMRLVQQAVTAAKRVADAAIPGRTVQAQRTDAKTQARQSEHADHVWCRPMKSDVSPLDLAGGGGGVTRLQEVQKMQAKQAHRRAQSTEQQRQKQQIEDLNGLLDEVSAQEAIAAHSGGSTHSADVPSTASATTARINSLLASLRPG